MSLFRSDNIFDVFWEATQPKKKPSFREKLERKAVLRLQKVLGIRDILRRLNDVERKLEARDSRSCSDLRSELNDVRVDARALSNLLTKFDARASERHRLLEQRMGRLEK
jgi:hypothetical protein